jgi:SET domain-containing protein
MTKASPGVRKASTRTLLWEAQKRIAAACPFRLRVRRSGIHRLGVFASRSIPPRVKVIEYAGERISRREARRRFVIIWKRHKGAFNYLARLNRYWVIDGAVGGNGAELINHSCDPNMGFRRKHGKLWFLSLRRIRKGEELTLDYRFSRKAEKVPCHCGSPKCRGTINKR